MDRVTLRIARSNPAADDAFEVPVGTATRILDSLLYVREELDPSLGFRYACRNGMCGSCAVVANGREALACQAPIGALGTSTIELAPLRGLPVLHDLVCDMTPFFDTFRRAHAALAPREPQRRTPRVMPPLEPARAAIERLNGCVTCGACDSALVAMGAVARPGLAAQNRVAMLVDDERDAQGRARADALAADALPASEQARDCANVCPAEIPLDEATNRLRALAGARGA
jgi:succinate dehydrogenase/fumarate reductase iron-sulfur protein